MTAVQITLTGDKELERLLRTLEAKKVKPALRKGTRAGAKRVAEKVKAIAPKDDGDYVKSIRVRAIPRSRKNKHVVGHRAISSGQFLSGENFYPIMQELGTSKMAANPHWRPGMQAAAPAAVGDISRETASAIRSL